MLDTASLRVSFGLLTLTMLVLFYFVTYRTMRSAYAGWWCASLALFLGGATAYLLDGTSQQVWANPLGNVLIVSGAGAVWAGARSLGSRRASLPVVCVVPAVVGIASALDDPATNVWSGGPFFLAGMWLLLGLAAVELWRLERTVAAQARPAQRAHLLSVRAIATGCSTVAVLYVVRWVIFLAVGWRDPIFQDYVGSEVTTLFNVALLAVVAFSMSTLSDEQQMARLREIAALDGLTGLLSRAEFLRRADDEIARLRRDGMDGQLVLADLDDLKRINDEQGHDAGDRAIIAFAQACRTAVRSTDLVARYGGDEFVLLLSNASPERAARVTTAIGAALHGDGPGRGAAVPGFSYGIAAIGDHLDLSDAIAVADAAMYRSKAAGRITQLPGT